MKNIDVITIGESMIVFNPVLDLSFIDSPIFMKQIAGAESNFAIGLSRLGHRVGWVSRVSNDSLGHYMINKIRGEGVDTSQVQFDNNAPTGLMIKEPLFNQQMNIHYYRRNSAASKMDISILNEKYFQGAKYLFITGITLALSESCKNTIFEAVYLAKKFGINTIFDPNIRLKLVKNMEEYKTILNETTRLVDIFLPGINEAQLLTGFEKPEDIVNYYLELNPNLEIVVKLGEHGCFYANNKELYYVKGDKVENIVDPIGAGDAFAAGLTGALLEGKSMKQALEQANLIGSIIVQTSGDVEGFPFKNQLDRYYSNNSKYSVDEVNR